MAGAMDRDDALTEIEFKFTVPEAVRGTFDALRKQTAVQAEHSIGGYTFTIVPCRNALTDPRSVAKATALSSRIPGAAMALAEGMPFYYGQDYYFDDAGGNITAAGYFLRCRIGDNGSLHLTLKATRDAESAAPSTTATPASRTEVEVDITELLKAEGDFRIHSHALQNGQLLDAQVAEQLNEALAILRNRDDWQDRATTMLRETLINAGQTFPLHDGKHITQHRSHRDVYWQDDKIGTLSFDNIRNSVRLPGDEATPEGHIYTGPLYQVVELEYAKGVNEEQTKALEAFGQHLADQGFVVDTESKHARLLQFEQNAYALHQRLTGNGLNSHAH